MTDWQALLHGWPYAAVLVDRENVVLARNPAAEQLFGADLDVGARLSRQMNYLEAGRRGLPDVVQLRAQGTVLYLEMTIAPLPNGGMVEFRPLARPGIVLDDRTRALVDAGIGLASEARIEGVLQRLVDAACAICNAQYAAMGVLDASGTRLAAFVTAGISEEERARLGEPPSGRGVLGHLIRHPDPIRLRDLRNHPASVGFPPHHPPMTSFLGVPVRTSERVFGNLYVTNKKDAPEFSDTDLALVEALAAQAAVAITNAQLRLSRDHFVAHAAHEIGNQLTTIRLVTGLLADEAAQMREGAELIRQMSIAAEESKRLLDDLMSLARMEQGQMDLAIEPHRVRPLIEDTASRARERALLAGKDLALDAITDAYAQVDAGRARQILLNLLSNAIKYGGTTVHAGARPLDHARLELWVADQGPGIPLEAQERIFDPWVRLDRERTEGSGIGLAVSRQLARLMGGDLLVDSRPGEGARFRLLLRRATATPAHDARRH